MRKLFQVLMLITILTSFTASLFAQSSFEHNIGVGMYDITGTAGDVVFMGYADSNQTAAGIHLRQRARAFIVQDAASGSSLVYVVAEIGQAFQSIKTGVVKQLAEKGYGDKYSEDNIMINATHTHNGPGGYSHYALYNMSVYGYIEENYNVIVDGIVASVIRAHNNLQPGYVEFNQGTCLETTVQRSIEAYENNPKNEQALYDNDVDKNMYVLNFRDASGKLVGLLNWFGIHGTSMSQDNQLISGDNKGAASYILEREMGTDYFSDDTFVAAFAQGNCGDASPNIKEGWVGYGGEDDFESTWQAGYIQYDAAKEISGTGTTRLSGAVDFRQQYLNFGKITVAGKYAGGIGVKTSTGAVGYSFAYGAEDGQSGLPVFYEGMTQEEYSYNDADDYVDNVQGIMNWLPILNDISGGNYPELWEEHYPKPILFATGKGDPYPWTAQIIPVQMITIGNFVVIGVPAEVTTMAGRRLTSSLEDTLYKLTGKEHTVVISGLTNSYTGYLTTPDEYDLQHYEGASVHYGRNTLAAYMQEFDNLAAALVGGVAIESDVYPPDLSNDQQCYQTKVIYDGTPIFTDFGDVETDAHENYRTGDTVKVNFWGGHPNNNFRTNDSFFKIQYKDGSNWVTVAYDWDFETKFKWERKDTFWGTSLSKIHWEIPSDAKTGTYRIKHNGAYKKVSGKIIEYTGKSREFKVE